jgi:hypothetical protein
MAWTKTANIKGEQGGAGTRSTEIILENSAFKPPFPEVILDGDISITRDGFISMYRHINLNFETGDTTDWEINNPNKIRVVDASDASWVAPYEGKYMLRISGGGIVKLKENVFASLWPFDTMAFACNSFQEGRDLVVSLYKQDGSEIKVETFPGKDNQWHLQIVFFDKYKDMTDIKTIGFYATSADIRIDDIRFNVPV